MKQKLTIIIRGFLYKENWRPLSGRRRRSGRYTIDFLECRDYYKEFIYKLKNKYDIDLFFSTYSTITEEKLSKIKSIFSPKEIFLSDEKGSTQFTTTIKALNLLKDNLGENELLLIIRGDLIIKQKLIDLICSFNFEKNFLYVLDHEKVHRAKIFDIFHVFDSSMTNQFLEYIKKPGLKDAHSINRKIKTKLMIKEPACQSTAHCPIYFEVYEGKV